MPKGKESLTIEQLKTLLHYDPETGIFTWLVYRNSNCPKGSNPRHIDKDGYVSARIDGPLYRMHRVAWFYVYGEWPPHDVDHINGERSDNRIANLRLATRSQNLCNQRLSSRNTTGYKGVVFLKKTNTYMGKLNHQGKPYFAGTTFKTAKDAHDALQKLRREIHGDFSRLG